MTNPYISLVILSIVVGLTSILLIHFVVLSIRPLHDMYTMYRFTRNVRRYNKLKNKLCLPEYLKIINK